MSNKLNNRVVTTEIYDSEDEDYSDDNYELDIDNRGDCDVEDEDTEELVEILSRLLEDVGNVYMLGKMKIRVEFFDANKIKFANKKVKCDFDIADDLYPIMPDGGEEYFIQYMEKVRDADPNFEKLSIETNVKGFKFKI
tara:strand:+ start:724 stop:1140 length:417 start_codon:yes stop_codon:yes gene_type:complete